MKDQPPAVCPRPSIVGTGLVALDAVVDEDTYAEPRLSAGGTCCNVLAILSYLGWDAFPVARLDTDNASAHVRQDLLRWSVRLDYVALTPNARTPVIVHHIQRRRDKAFHKFLWNCPQCGHRLPTFRPVSVSAARAIAPQLPVPHVFFMDRVSQGALILAQASAAQGAVVVFEPSGVGDPQLFREAIHVSHIVKYSRERLRDLPEMRNIDLPPLTVETLGAAGLRYRSRIDTSAPGEWEHLKAYEVGNVKDTAGSGDWCTSGLIHKLGWQGVHGLRRMNREQLQDGLRYGQALAAWNCMFEGARGGMYCTGGPPLESTVRDILAGPRYVGDTLDCSKGAIKGHFQQICGHCLTED
jgi:fructokinase